MDPIMCKRRLSLRSTTVIERSYYGSCIEQPQYPAAKRTRRCSGRLRFVSRLTPIVSRSGVEFDPSLPVKLVRMAVFVTGSGKAVSPVSPSHIKL
jgi:hypothetical protein